VRRFIMGVYGYTPKDKKLSIESVFRAPLHTRATFLYVLGYNLEI
jgi:hypothetical protein